jgi:hypothetical protein
MSVLEVTRGEGCIIPLNIHLYIYLTDFIIPDLRLSRWFVVYVDSALGSLQCVNARVAHVSEVYSASIFRFEVSGVGVHVHIAYNPTDPRKDHG